MDFKNYYLILGVSPTATKQEIISAYKTLAIKWHPDINKEVEATAAMQLINEAYEVLSDATRRFDYDLRRKHYYSTTNTNNHQTHNSSPKPQEPKVVKCHYCSELVAKGHSENFIKRVILYKVTNRTPFGVHYQTATVHIHRCKRCYDFHKSPPSRRIYLLVVPVFTLLIYGIIMSYYFSALQIAINVAMGVVLGAIFLAIDDRLIDAEFPFKKEYDFEEHDTVKIMLKNGWQKTKPTA